MGMGMEWIRLTMFANGSLKDASRPLLTRIRSGRNRASAGTTTLSNAYS